jgi:hypothetical protein
MADSDNKPRMNWLATDLEKEWKRFKQHCTFTFDGGMKLCQLTMAIYRFKLIPDLLSV